MSRSVENGAGMEGGDEKSQGVQCRGDRHMGWSADSVVGGPHCLCFSRASPACFPEGVVPACSLKPHPGVEGMIDYAYLRVKN